MTKYMLVFIIGVLVGVLLTQRPTPTQQAYRAVRAAEKGGIADLGTSLEDL